MNVRHRARSTRLPALGAAAALALASAYDWSLTPSTAARLATTVRLEPVGQFGGRSGAVVVDGQYAYVGVGPRLVVLAAPGQDTPQFVGQSEPMPEVVRDVAVSEGRAYVATGSGGVHVVDVTDPRLPLILSSVPSDSAAIGIAVARGYAYATETNGTLQVIDVREPNQARSVATLDVGRPAQAITVQSNALYLAQSAGDLVLKVYDISRPALPNLRGEVTMAATTGTSEIPFRLRIRDGMAYIGAPDGLHIVDVSDPPAPRPVGFAAVPRSGRSIALAGNRALIANWYAGVSVIDITDRAAPRRVTVLPMLGRAEDIEVRGSTAFVANGTNGGVTVLDLADPDMPRIVASYGPSGDASAAVVDGNTLYIAQFTGGVSIVDVSDPTDPAVVGRLEGIGFVRDLAITGNHLLAAVSGYNDGFWDFMPLAGLRVIDVRDKRAPREVAWVSRGRLADRILLAGRYAYISSFNGDFRVVDVSDPAAPQVVGELQGDCLLVAHMAISRNHVFIAGEQCGLGVIDVSDPANPREVARPPMRWNVSMVAAVGTILYLAYLDGSFDIFDATDPTRPRQMSTYVTSGVGESGPTDFIVENGLAFVASAHYGANVLDVSDPFRPRLLAHADTPGIPMSLDLTDEHLFVADYPGGVGIFRVVAETEPVTTPAASPAPVPTATATTPAGPAATIYLPSLRTRTR